MTHAKGISKKTIFTVAKISSISSQMITSSHVSRYGYIEENNLYCRKDFLNLQSDDYLKPCLTLRSPVYLRLPQAITHAMGISKKTIFAIAKISSISSQMITSSHDSRYGYIEENNLHWRYALGL
ncbi:hypothetical protein RRG08_016113 [Elysia crispata]|uniref:Uncharacterized protein n=1 Tax=Elysia crispata TaxID=231223 RepID=A0AAE0ZNZ6_9GAST|nr:hypothetical protein RRG08_016113 [Elysia crispata]